MPQRSTDWHISGPLAILLLPIMLPAAIVVAILGAVFGKGRGRERSAAEVAGYLRDFIDDTGGTWDWDDFTSVSIQDPALDEIRQEAASLRLPPGPDELQTLEHLLAKAQALSCSRKVSS